MKLLVLAAGQGKRLGCEQTRIPKVMCKALGKPLLQYVLDATDFIPREDIWVVVGFQKQVVIDAFPTLNYAVQEQRLGTGHAVMCAAEAMGECDDNIMVINGDMPLFSKKTIKAIMNAHKENGAECTMVTFNVAGEIPPFGHIVRDNNGCVAAIVEHKDASDEQKLIRELNAGIYIFKGQALFSALNKLEKSPVTGEYYLTAVPSLIAEVGGRTMPYMLEDEIEALSVNTPEELEAVESALKHGNK